MGSIIDVADVTRDIGEQRLIDLTADEPIGDEYVVNEDTVNEEIAAAEGFLYGAIKRRGVAVPLQASQVTAELRKDALLLVRVALFRRREAATAEHVSAEKRLHQKYKEIAQEKRDLTGITPTTQHTGTGAAATGTEDNFFDDDDPLSF